MTRYVVSLAPRGTVHPIGDARTYDNSYTINVSNPGKAPSVYSGEATCVQSFGPCSTPHAVNVAQHLVNGLCELCRVNQE